MVTWENYEEMMLLHVDGELNVTEEKALMQFVMKHPELREELESYETARLMPDMTMAFPSREELMKPVSSGRVISFTSWLRYGVAAAAMLVLLFTAGKWFFASNDTAKIKDAAPVVSNTVKQANPALVQHDQPTVAPAAAIEKENQSRRSASYAIAKPASVHSNEKGLPSSKKSEIQSIRSLNSAIAVAKAEALPLTAAIQPADLPQASIPVAEEQATEQEHPQEFLAWLPMTDEKKEGIEGLKTNLKEKFAKAKNIRDNLRETDLVLKLGARDIHVLNF